jgi:hypothetical protein
MSGLLADHGYEGESVANGIGLAARRRPRLDLVDAVCGVEIFLVLPSEAAVDRTM